MFLRESIRYAKMITDEGLLVRLDSGNDSVDNIRVCVDKGVDWLIKRNLRREDIQEWLKIAQEKGQKETLREVETHRVVDGFAAPLWQNIYRRFMVPVP